MWSLDTVRLHCSQRNFHKLYSPILTKLSTLWCSSAEMACMGEEAAGGLPKERFPPRKPPQPLWDYLELHQQNHWHTSEWSCIGDQHREGGHDPADGPAKMIHLWPPPQPNLPILYPTATFPHLIPPLPAFPPPWNASVPLSAGYTSLCTMGSLLPEQEACFSPH